MQKLMELHTCRVKQQPYYLPKGHIQKILSKKICFRAETASKVGALEVNLRFIYLSKSILFVLLPLKSAKLLLLSIQINHLIFLRKNNLKIPCKILDSFWFLRHSLAQWDDLFLRLSRYWDWKSACSEINGTGEFLSASPYLLQQASLSSCKKLHRVLSSFFTTGYI